MSRVQVWTGNRNHSSFQFSVTHLGLSTFRASFGDIDARLADDDGTITLVGHARADSISIDDPDFRAHVVHGADFFEADTHPLILFRSTSIELGDDRSVVVSGELEIRGVSRPVTATGTYSPTITDPFGVSRAALELSAASTSGLGDELAVAAPRRRRRAGLGGRDHRRPGAGERRP